MRFSYLPGVYVNLATAQIWEQTNKFAFICSFQIVIQTFSFASRAKKLDNSLYF